MSTTELTTILHEFTPTAYVCTERLPSLVSSLPLFPSVQKKDRTEGNKRNEVKYLRGLHAGLKSNFGVRYTGLSAYDVGFPRQVDVRQEHVIRCATFNLEVHHRCAHDFGDQVTCLIEEVTC